MIFLFELLRINLLHILIKIKLLSEIYQKFYYPYCHKFFLRSSLYSISYSQFFFISNRIELRNSIINNEIELFKIYVKELKNIIFVLVHQ